MDFTRTVVFVVFKPKNISAENLPAVIFCGAALVQAELSVHKYGLYHA